jgi:hypothetical protein
MRSWSLLLVIAAGGCAWIRHPGRELDPYEELGVTRPSRPMIAGAPRSTRASLRRFIPEEEILADSARATTFDPIIEKGPEDDQETVAKRFAEYRACSARGLSAHEHECLRAMIEQDVHESDSVLWQLVREPPDAVEQAKWPLLAALGEDVRGPGASKVAAEIERTNGIGTPPNLAACEGVFPFDEAELKKAAASNPRIACVLLSMATELAAALRGHRSLVTDALRAREKAVQAFRSSEGFRDARWGMTEAEVRRTFPSARKATDEPNALAITDTIGREPATIWLRFSEGRLTRAAVLFGGLLFSPASEVLRYFRIREVMREKYGAPELQNDGAPATADELANAMMLGTIPSRETVWRTGRTTITLRCGRVDFGLATPIEYRSEELARLIERDEDRSKKDAANGL